MFKFGKRGQMTVYVAEDIQAPFLEFADNHPIASASDITNAALRVFLPLAAQYGVNGRLMPLLPEHDGSSSTQTMHGIMQQLGAKYTELLDKYEALMNKYESQRRVVWTDEQRRSFREGGPVGAPVETKKTRSVSSRRDTK